MKRSLLLIAAICLISAVVAQKEIKSGSFQFLSTNGRDKKIEKIILENEYQKIELEKEDFTNIIAVNLFPDEYSISVIYKFHHVLQTVSQKIIIEEGKRTVCSLNEQNQLSFSFQNDGSSILTIDPELITTTVADVSDAFVKIIGNMAQMHQSDVNHQVHISHSHDSKQDSFHNHDNNKNNHHSSATVEKKQKPISEADFNNIVSSIKKEPFDEDKVSALKTIANFHDLFTSEQVRKLASLFSYENDKLEIVQYLSPKVSDTTNLPMLKDCFTYSSTKEEYLEFIRTLKK